MSDCLSGICIDEDGAISDLGRCEGFTRIHAGIDGVWVFRHHAPERKLDEDGMHPGANTLDAATIVKLVRTGGKPTTLGLACWVAIALVSLGMQHVLGIW